MYVQGQGICCDSKHQKHSYTDTHKIHNQDQTDLPNRHFSSRAYLAKCQVKSGTSAGMYIIIYVLMDNTIT